MKFSKQQVIDASRKRITMTQQKVEDDYKKEMASYEDQKAAWITQYSARYRKMAQTILDAVDDGKVVTTEMVDTVKDKNGYRTPTFDRKVPEKAEPKIAQYERLIATLEAMDDDHITRAELKELGFAPTEIF